MAKTNRKTLSVRVSEIEERLSRIEGLLCPTEVSARSKQDNAGEPDYVCQLEALIKEQMKTPLKALVITAGFARLDEGRNETPRWTSVGGFDSTQELSAYLESVEEHKITECCAQFASKEKLAIIRALVAGGTLSRQELLSGTEISQGQFYHYIHGLIATKLVERPKQDTYRLTSRGILFVTTLLSSVVAHLKIIDSSNLARVTKPGD